MAGRLQLWAFARFRLSPERWLRSDYLNMRSLALLFFNVGVEIGQLIFVGAVLSAISLLRYAASRLLEPRPAAEHLTGSM
jgi:hypothetical protein